MQNKITDESWSDIMKNNQWKEIINENKNENKNKEKKEMNWFQSLF